MHYVQKIVKKYGCDINMDEKELRQAVVTIELYKAQLDNFVKQNNIINLSLQECMRARETLSKYKELQFDDEVLVPIGADIYIFSKVTASQKVLVGIGSNTIIETTIDYAITKCDMKIKELREGGKQISERIMNIEREINLLSQKVQKELEKRSARAKPIGAG
jgi:prefoldin alpha subunit